MWFIFANQYLRAVKTQCPHFCNSHMYSSCFMLNIIIWFLVLVFVPYHLLLQWNRFSIKWPSHPRKTFWNVYITPSSQGLHSPVIWSRTEYPLSQWRPANMEYFRQVPSEDLQRLIGAGGQVVHTDIFILTACCYHVPTKREKNAGWYV